MCDQDFTGNLYYLVALPTINTFHFQGLIKTASDLDLNLLAPRKKITVLLIGNHSAGKSSFINW